jgi:tetratricopeptide (TPR) repeat protein
MDGAAEEFSYDLVVCDEVQDLTDVQVSLLFRLAVDPRAVVLTGDPRQIINPSGFRWEEVKNKFYERGLPVPIVHRLSLNFRCVGSIVRLSNALLDIKAGLVGLSDTDMREEWKFGGRPPLVLSGFEEEEALERIDFRAAGQIILARTAEERDGLKQALATELVFTIAEAKGLEFDTILLWKFCGDPATETLWKTIRSGEPLADARIPHVRHELALLYVAVTRARNTLIIYDGVDPSVIWEIDAIASLVFRTAERERLAELMNAVSSPEEWEAQGDYFLGHKHYAAARECFKNAGNDKKLDLASAFLALLQGDHGKAAALFESGGERERAADCYEHAGDWRRALGLWKSLGEKRRASLCAVHVSELDGDFTAAAQGWEALGEQSRALECWEKAGAFDRVGRALAAAGHYERAARLLEKAGLPLEAAACLARIGREERAADLYAQAGELKLAVRLYKKSGSDEKLRRCYRRLEDHMAIVHYYESRGDVRKAIETLHSYAGASEERRAELLASIPPVKSKRSALKAAVRYAALGMPDKAGPLFLRAGEIEIAAQEMEKAGDFRGLSQSYMQMSRYLDAARALEKADLDEHDMVDQVQRILYRHFSAGPANEKKAVQALHAEALRMKSEGRLAPALARFRLLQDEDNVREICLQKGWHEDAIRYFLNSDNLAQAKKYAEVNSVTVSEQFLRAIIKEHWAHPGLGSRQREDLTGLLFALLDASLRSAPREMTRERIEKFFYAAFGRTISVNLLPRAAFDLLILHRVANVIISILRYNLQFRAPSDPHLQAFISALSRAARDSADPDLAACAAYASNSDSFEQQVTTLALTDANVEVIATSRSRYPEAVMRMNSMGRGAEAESFCRFHGDLGLAARIAEERGNARDAARQYMDARDFPAAIRCFTAAKDERGIARVYERMGQVDAALAIWKKIGNKREVQRLHKKYPLAGPAVDTGQKELF